MAWMAVVGAAGKAGQRKALVGSARLGGRGRIGEFGGAWAARQGGARPAWRWLALVGRVRQGGARQAWMCTGWRGKAWPGVVGAAGDAGQRAPGRCVWWRGLAGQAERGVAEEGKGLQGEDRQGEAVSQIVGVVFQATPTRCDPSKFRSLRAAFAPD